MIEIAYGIHDHYGSYYNYLGVSIFSVIENTSEKLRFHILCDESLTSSARHELSELCKSFDKEILFYDITLDERISIRELLEAGYCEGILYRLYLPELLPDISKIIYLDCDILANGDIKGLWEINVDELCAAGRWDPPLLGFIPLPEEKRKRMASFWEETDWNRYINSGVLVMNLDRIRREHRLLEESISFLEKHAYSLPDQDAINYVLRGKTGFIPGCYNMPNKDCPEVREGIFYHYSYIGEDTDKLDPIDRLFLDYWERSPFYDDSFGKKEKISFLRNLKNRREAYERLEGIRALSFPEQMNYCLWLYLRGDYKECYDRLLCSSSGNAGDESSSDNPFQTRGDLHFFNHLVVMAKCLRGMGRTSEAIALLQEEMKGLDDPSYIEKIDTELELWDFLGELLYEDSRYKEAEAAYKKALYYGNTVKTEIAIKALRHLIKCTLRMGDISGAKHYYTMLSSLRPLDESVKIYGLQIEIAERKKKSSPL